MICKKYLQHNLCRWFPHRTSFTEFWKFCKDDAFIETLKRTEKYGSHLGRQAFAKVDDGTFFTASIENVLGPNRIHTWLHASYTFTRKFKYIDLNQTKLVEFVSSFQNSNIFASFWNICKYQALSFWIKQLSFSFNRGFGSQRFSKSCYFYNQFYGRIWWCTKERSCIHQNTMQMKAKLVQRANFLQEITLLFKTSFMNFQKRSRFHLASWSPNFQSWML